VRVAVSGLHNAINWATIFHAQLVTSSSISQADLDSWTLAFGNAWKTRFLPQINTSTTVANTRSVLYTPGGGELLSVQTTAGTGSSGASDLADNAASMVVSWLSTVYWRGGKPRTYLPGVQSGDVTAAHLLTAGKITSLQSAAASFRTDVNALTSGTITGTTFGFVSFRTGNEERGTPLFFAITGAAVHGRIGTQRRRLGKWVN
jgi:hypothetical protein